MQTKFDPGALPSQTLVLPFQRLSVAAEPYRARVGRPERDAALRKTCSQVVIPQRLEDFAWIFLALTSLAALVLSLLI
jgi:hypothetical protein